MRYATTRLSLYCQIICVYTHAHETKKGERETERDREGQTKRERERERERETMRESERESERDKQVSIHNMTYHSSDIATHCVLCCMQEQCRAVQSGAEQSRAVQSNAEQCRAV